MNNNVFPRFQKLQHELKSAESALSTAGDRRDWDYADKAEKDIQRLERKIRLFKPSDKDKAEALELAYARRESLTNEIAQLEAVIIELGGRT